jgi:hypothetical protein
MIVEFTLVSKIRGKEKLRRIIVISPENFYIITFFGFLPLRELYHKASSNKNKLNSSQ